MVSDKFGNWAWNSAGQTNEELATRVAVDFVIDVSLDLSLVPNLESLTGSVDFSQVNVHVGASIEVSPEDFSVGGVVSTGEILFSTIIDDRDTNWSHCHSVAGSMMLLFIIPVSSPT